MHRLYVRNDCVLTASVTPHLIRPTKEQPQVVGLLPAPNFVKRQAVTPRPRAAHKLIHLPVAVTRQVSQNSRHAGPLVEPVDGQHRKHLPDVPHVWGRPKNGEVDVVHGRWRGERGGRGEWRGGWEGRGYGSEVVCTMDDSLQGREQRNEWRQWNTIRRYPDW